MFLNDLEDMIAAAKETAKAENKDISNYQVQTFRNCPENLIRVNHRDEMIEILGTAKHAKKSGKTFGF